MSATVTVRGTAVVPVQPDEVELALELTHLASTPDVALTEVSRRSKELERLFEELAVGRDRWTTSGVSLQEEYEWNQRTGQQTLRGLKATTTVTLRLRDATPVGRLMGEAARRAQARIAGPWWRIAPDNPGRAEACRRAALDARRKAEGYVSALGGRLGSIVEINEPGLTPPRPPQPQMAMLAKRQLADTAEHAPEVAVQAGTLEVSASVVVTFAVEQGG